MTIKLAVPNKGRLNERALQLIGKAGIDLGDDWGRRLSVSIPELGLEVFLVRAHDIPLFIDSGAIDFGITGQDVVYEAAADLETLLPMDFGRCRLSIAAPEGSEVAEKGRLFDGIRIATSYPNLTRRFCEKQGVKAKIVDVQGAAEVMPRLGVCDAISDIVATGSTLRMNRLKEAMKIVDSEACVFASKAAMADPSKRDGIMEIVDMIKAVLDAESKRYLMADVPKDRMAEAERILPGISGPTVLDIAGDSDFAAVHAVVQDSQVYRVVSDLRKIGARGILTVPIDTLVERMVDRSWMRRSVSGLEMYYNPVVGKALRMDTNTNVLGSNPAAEAYLKSVKVDLNGYPNTYSDGLRDALADVYGLKRDNFVAGNGSDEILNTIFTTFSEPNETVCTIPDPSYSLYSYFVQLSSGKLRTADLTEDFQLDVDAMVGKGDERKGVLIMPSPNNPTGNCFRQKDIEEILSKHEGIVILDEAYSEYAEQTMIDRVDEFENLIVCKTFSKAYAMAALRIGYCAANLKVAGMLNSVKVPYSLNAVSEGAAIAALKDRSFVERSVAMVKDQRPKLAGRLKELGFEPYPSDANFILAKAPIDHAKLVEGVKRHGVLIRDFGTKRRTPNCVRPTVGTEELNRVMTDAIEATLAEEKR